MFMNLYDYAEERNISIRRVLDLTLTTNPLGPSSKAKAAIRKAMKSVALFPDPEVRYLKKYIAGKEQIGTENILFSHGSSQALGHLLQALRPDRVLVPTPLPRYYAALLKRRCNRLITLPLLYSEGFSVNIEVLVSQIDGVDVVILPNPHVMTGMVLSAAHLSKIIEKVQESGKTLIVDEAFMEFVGVASPVNEAIHSDNALIVRTFSLFHALAGLRLGYAIGSSKLIGRLKEIIGTAPVSTLAAAGAITSLRDKGYYQRTEAFLREEKSYLSGKLARIRSVEIIDTPCNFLLLKVKKASAELDQRFLEGGVLIETFEDAGHSFIRLPVRTRRENARFAKTVARLIAADTPLGA